MSSDAALGELLVRENLMTPAQLKIAQEYQQQLGGDLRSIVVKLGYVKDSVLAGVVAQEEHVATSSEITPEVLDYDALRTIPRQVLEKHQVVPLLGDGSSLVLAMADPNDLRAIEEIQFLVNRAVEPAVATKAAIRKTLNQLADLIKKHEAKAVAAAAPKTSGGLPADRVKALKDLPFEKLVRAYVLLQAERGQLPIDDLLARASKL